MRLHVLTEASVVMTGEGESTKQYKFLVLTVLFPLFYSRFSSVISSNPSQSHLALRVTLRTVLRGNCQSMTFGFSGHLAVYVSWGTTAALSLPQYQCWQGP